MAYLTLFGAVSVRAYEFSDPDSMNFVDVARNIS
jgi:hypothetical protein